MGQSRALDSDGAGCSMGERGVDGLATAKLTKSFAILLVHIIHTLGYFV